MSNSEPCDASKRFLDTVVAIDEINAQDPRKWIDNKGRPGPYEVVYAKRLTSWVLELDPKASEQLLLAARAQHFARWTIPRNDYLDGLDGYLRWREDHKQFHAKNAASVVVRTGYGEESIHHVMQLIRKDGFPDHPESRVLEDALCLMFIESQLADFARGKTEEKAIEILRKTWEKMTPAARDIACTFDLEQEVKNLMRGAKLI